MMKGTLTLALVLTLGAATGVAAPVIVDFASLGINVLDITTPGGQNLSGVNFFYDTAGGADTAVIQSSGVFITSGAGGGFTGVLDLTFPTIGLQGSMSFDFALAPVGVYIPGVLAILDNGDAQAPVTDASGTGRVSFGPPSLPFTVANVTPAPGDVNALLFNISSLTYDTTPEPGTYALLGTGLFVLGLGSRRLSKRSS